MMPASALERLVEEAKIKLAPMQQPPVYIPPLALASARKAPPI